MFVVAVTRHVNISEAKVIANDPDDDFLFEIKSFRDMLSFAEDVAAMSCEYTG